VPQDHAVGGEISLYALNNDVVQRHIDMQAHLGSVLVFSAMSR
jgi:hypothetical protein